MNKIVELSLQCIITDQAKTIADMRQRSDRLRQNVADFEAWLRTEPAQITDWQSALRKFKAFMAQGETP